jgi:hypothetical protein
VRYAGKAKPHLDAGQRGDHGEVVGVAEVADAEYLAGELGQAGAQRHVEVLECRLAEGVGVVPRGQQDGGQGGGVILRVLAPDLEAPRARRPAHALGMAIVAREHAVEALLVQHVDGLGQAVEQVGGGRVGEEALLVGGQHVLPGEIRLRQLGGLGRRQRLVAHGVEAQPRWQHQAFLRAPHRDVDAPLVVPVVDGGQRGDGVDHEQRRMPGRIDGAPHLVDARGSACRGLVMHDAHGLDGVPLVLFEARLDGASIGAAAPVGGNELRLQPELGGHALPQRGEMPGLVHQHLVAGGERVHQRRLPGASAGGGIDEHRARGLEDGLDPREHLQPERLELRPAMVDDRHVHGPQDPVRHRRRPGDLQVMAAGAAWGVGHGRASIDVAALV